MRYVIVDLEATCWETGQTPQRMEIIEIGAVLMETGTDKPNAEFAKFVKPINEPILSEFCTKLTSIRQAEVDKAEKFYQVFPQFIDWIGDKPFTICSWGNYDMSQFKIDCERHSIIFPDTFLNHINLKSEFARLKNVKRCGMKGALWHLNLPLEGTHHRGIDDARNIAKIAQVILPQIEKGE